MIHIPEYQQLTNNLSRQDQPGLLTENQELPATEDCKQTLISQIVSN